MSTVLILADFAGEKATKATVEIATAGAVIGEVTALVLAPVGRVQPMQPPLLRDLLQKY